MLNTERPTWNWISFIYVLGKYQDVPAVMDAAARAWVDLIASGFHQRWDQGTFQRIFGRAAEDGLYEPNKLRLNSNEKAVAAVIELLRQLQLQQPMAVEPNDPYPGSLERTLELHAQRLGLEYPSNW